MLVHSRTVSSKTVLVVLARNPMRTAILLYVVQNKFYKLQFVTVTSMKKLEKRHKNCSQNETKRTKHTRTRILRLIIGFILIIIIVSIIVITQRDLKWLNKNAYVQAGSTPTSRCSATSSIKPISRDSTTIRRYHDAFDYDESDRNYDMRSIRLRYDYDTTATKKWHVHFLLASSGSRRARYVVVGS